MTQQDSFGPGRPAPLPPPPPGYPPGHYRQAPEDAPAHGGPPYGSEPYGAQPYGDQQHAAQPYGAQGYGAPSYDAPAYPTSAYGEPGRSAGPGYGYAPPPEYGYPAPPPKTNVMAILGLVFAFLFSPLGVVFSAIGLSQTKRRGEKGRGLALAGLIVAIVALALEVLVVVLAVAAAQQQLDTTSATTQSATGGVTHAPAGSSTDTGAGSGTGSGTGGTDGAGATPGLTGSDPQGVVTACRVILPALMGLETDLRNVSTPDEYSQALATLEKTLGDAAAGASDPGFVQDVARLDADLDRAAAAVQAGQSPAGLANALESDAVAVGADCGTAGSTD